MAEPRKKWLKLTGLGCGLLILLGVVLFGGLLRSVSRGYRTAVASREILDKEYGDSATFTPERSGGIHPDRLRRYCAVRRALFPMCETVTAHQEAFQRMETHRTSEDPPPVDLLVDVARAARSVFSMGDEFGEYLIKRNETMVDYEIGLGEYTWIYVLANYAWQENQPVKIVPGQSRPSIFHARVFPEVREMIRRHIPVIEKAIPKSKPIDRPALEEQLAAWTRELEALDNDDQRIPFQDGLPAELEASMRSFRTQIKQAACPAAGELDLTRTVKTRLWYDHN